MSHGHNQAVLDNPDTYPDIPDYTRRTPLSLPAFESRIGVVSLLLARLDVAPGHGFLYDHYHRPYDTPVMLAASQGHGAMQSIEGTTALAVAVEVGHFGAVSLMLGRSDVNVNKQDNGGRTPLMQVAENGRTETMKLLLERDDLDVDVRSTLGMSALAYAAEAGHIDAVALLISTGGMTVAARH
ncbi:hypothetical protein VE03_03544 [Pseudogymnoascus sp. 23342-1-I1]|nr:hypothetical protein VE03_03544 [Pseudogymnoascus sp. 23342-1-I1]